MHEWVIVLTTRKLGPSEAGTDLKGFRRGNRHHGVGEDGFEFVKDWFSETERAISDDTSDSTAHRVVASLCSPYGLVSK